MHRALVSTVSVSAALVLVPAVGAARIAPTPRLPAGWSHAEINVIVRGVPHTLVYDRGRIQAVTASSLTIREPDGSSQTINVSPSALVTIDGRPAPFALVRKAEIAIALRIDGADATRVTVRIPPAVAARIAQMPASGAGSGFPTTTTTRPATTVQQGTRR